MEQSDLRDILIKVLLGVIWAVLFAFFIRIIQKVDVKRNRPTAIEKKLDFLVNRQLFCSKYHMLTKIASALCVLFAVLELIFMIRRENILDFNLFLDLMIVVLLLFTFGISILSSFLDNQIAVKQRGIWCKFGFTEKIVKKEEIISAFLNDDGTLFIRLTNETEIILKGLKQSDKAQRSLKELVDTKKQ